ncbi:MAG: energy-coupling factor transporter transmembrane component T family protein [Anaerolineae bacterium]
MSPQFYQEGDSLLHRLNPVVKLIAFSILMIVPALFLNPVVPAVFLALALLLGWGLGGFSPIKVLRTLAPFLVLAASLVLFNTVFYGGPRVRLLAHLGPLTLWEEALAVGISIGLRLLCFTSYSALFVWTTTPSQLAASLIQQARFPYQLAYAILAAYRFLPILQRELEHIRAAHRVRGAYAEGGLLGKKESWRRYGIPLLANGIRQAERLAVAMDARGFGALPTRTQYVQSPLAARDFLFLATVLLTVVAILLTSASLGLLQGFLAGPAESLTGGQP